MPGENGIHGPPGIPGYYGTPGTKGAFGDQGDGGRKGLSMHCMTTSIKCILTTKTVHTV